MNATSKTLFVSKGIKCSEKFSSTGYSVRCKDEKGIIFFSKHLELFSPYFIPGFIHRKEEERDKEKREKHIQSAMEKIYQESLFSNDYDDDYYDDYDEY